MTTPARTRSTRVGVGGTALAAVLLLAGSACSGDDSGDGSPEGGTGAPGTTGSDTPPVETRITLETVSGELESVKRVRVKAAVNQIVDQWFDGAFIGDFPRSDYDAAFAAFTDGAQAEAVADLDVMSNQAIADRIDSASAVNRRVRLEVFAPEGRPRGATARFVLDFTTEGEQAGERRVTGSLYLVKREGEWHVFGYDVLEGVDR